MKTMEEQFDKFLDNHQKMRNKTRRKPRGIKRYKAYEYEGDPSMSVDRDGEWVEYSDYEKLLAKYNGVFEWVYNNEDQLPYLDTADEIKTSYEESLNEIQASKKEQEAEKSNTSQQTDN